MEKEGRYKVIAIAKDSPAEKSMSMEDLVLAIENKTEKFQLKVMRRGKETTVWLDKKPDGLFFAEQVCVLT